MPIEDGSGLGHEPVEKDWQRAFDDLDREGMGRFNNLFGVRVITGGYQYLFESESEAEDDLGKLEQMGDFGKEQAAYLRDLIRIMKEAGITSEDGKRFGDIRNGSRECSQDDVEWLRGLLDKVQVVYDEMRAKGYSNSMIKEGAFED